MRARIIAGAAVRRRRSPSQRSAPPPRRAGRRRQTASPSGCRSTRRRELGADREGGQRPFQKAHPGVERQRPVPDVGEPPPEVRRDAGGRNAPDVIEMGNTEMTKYMAAGAFQDLSGSVLPQLRAPGSRASPRPAATAGSSTASRTTRARESSPTAPTCSRRSRRRSRRAWRVHRAGEEDRPRTRKGVLARLHRRHRLVRRDELRLRLRRKIATTREGKWKGTLDTPAALAGLTAYKNFFNAASRASKTTDEAHPNPYTLRHRGNAASTYGAGVVQLLRR